jgi:hypothetical protein
MIALAMSPLVHHNIEFIPSIHQRIAFAEEVRRAFALRKPAVVAVELPPALAEWIVRGVRTLPAITVVSFPAPARSGELLYLPVDPCDSMIEAVRLALNEDVEIAWIDDAPAPESLAPSDLPDDLTVERAGLERYVEAVAPYLKPPSNLPSPEAAAGEARDRAMADRLIALARRRARVLCVLGLAHYLPVRRLIEERWDAGIEELPESRQRAPRVGEAYFSHLNSASIPGVLKEVPAVASAREDARRPTRHARMPRYKKLDALRDLLKTAQTKHHERTKAEITLTQQRALYQFTRNLALAQGRLQPDAYDLVIGAKDTVDGDFGFEVYELARAYAHQPEESALPTLTIENGRGTFSDREEKFRMVPLFGEEATEKVSIRFRRRPPMEMRELWREQFGNQALWSGICSWPPEDETQEKFMMFLRKRALEVISEDKRQVVEFTTSLMDGLDVRETMRNWHTGKLYVHQKPQPQGKVGAVVVAFDDPRNDARYPWRVTLYAENQNESDISIYATPMGVEVVGPRISRTEFGGILSIYPAPGIPDIWQTSVPEELESCGDVLLAAAILFSEDRFIANVAGRPPSSRLRELAAQYKKRIIHMPIVGFPAGQMRKIRLFHILAGRHVRDWAGDYIFED